MAYTVWGTTFLNFDVWQAASAIVLVLVLAAILRWTPLGRQIKATRVNPELATHHRHQRQHRSTSSCFFIGTIFAGVAAIWYGLKYTVDPGMGFTPVIYAFVVAFLAGTASSPIRVFITGIVVALIEQYSSIWLSARWTQTAVFVVLRRSTSSSWRSRPARFSTRLRRTAAGRRGREPWSSGSTTSIRSCSTPRWRCR